MFEKLEQSEGKVIGFRAVGKLTDEDYKSLIPQLEEIIEKEGKVRVLMNMHDFEGFTLKAAMDDTMYWLKHDKDTEKCAVIGDKKWEEWLIKAVSIFRTGK
jgi:hypothetical protein